MITNTVTQNDSAAAGAAQRQAEETESSASAAASSDFETFLTLLTAQLRNQDPLSPLDSTQFVEQLASFSAVEQQIETNSLLKDLTSSLSASGLEEASQWIGRVVEIPGGAAYFEGDALTYRIAGSERGAASEAVVSNADGDVIYRETLEPGQEFFSWDGKTDSGEPAPEGSYAVAINYVEGGEVVDTLAPITVSEVTEARYIDSEPRLILASGLIVEPDSVLAVRAAETGGGDDGEAQDTEDSDVLPSDA